jgi:hypothetical protein
LKNNCMNGTYLNAIQFPYHVIDIEVNKRTG